MLTLKEWRRAKGVSMSELAEQLHVSVSTVNNWENKGQKMPVDLAIKACEYLGVDFKDVIFFANE